jgi:glycosyltransferase involved in cell wall biosynthesis
MIPMGAQWYLYSPQPYDSRPWEASGCTQRIQHVSPWLGGSQAAQGLFPLWLRRDAIEVFWSPRHHLPLALPPGIASVVSVHDIVWKRCGASMPASRRWVEAAVMPRSLRRADRILAASDFTASELCLEYPALEARLHTVYHASCFADRPVKPAAAPADGGYFLFVGTLEPRKNLPRLLRAYQAYRSRATQPLRLVIAGGEGWGSVDLRALVAVCGLQAWVDFRGKVSDDELAALYRSARALLMPSLYEGFGLPVVEALSLGTPVLVSRESAMSEVCGDAGLVVDPESEAEICAAMLRLSDDPICYTGLAERAVPRVSRYSWDRSAAKVFQLLTEWR